MMMLRDQEFFFSNIYLIEALSLAVVVDGLGFIFAVWRIGLYFLHTGFISKRRLYRCWATITLFCFFFFVPFSLFFAYGWLVNWEESE